MGEECLPPKTTLGMARGWAIAVHGGAGVDPGLPAERQQQARAVLARCLRLGVDALQRSLPAVDVVEIVVKELESDPLFNAGRGAALASNGTAELEASIMDGDGRRCGAVSGLKSVKNPISLARLVMDNSPHSYLAFDGAEEFARIQGVELVDNSYFITEENLQLLQLAKQANDIREPLDPFSLVADELTNIAHSLRDMVVAEVPKLASAAEYFFKMGVEGKRFRPTVLLLMASALNMPIKGSPQVAISSTPEKLRARQRSIAEIIEMIHVASLLHDDVLDDAQTRRGIGSLNFVMGNKISVLAGDFLLSRACVALAALKDTEVVSLIATVVEHLVTGETMQMTSTSEQRCSMEYYLQKTYYKTASLISNSCKSIAILAGQTAEVSMLAFEYGKNLGLAYQLIDDVLDFTGTSASLGKGSLSDIRHGIVTAPILFAIEEFPQLREVVNRGFDNPENVDIALEYLGKSQGIQRAQKLAAEHADHAARAIESLPESDDENVKLSRRALVDLTRRVITRTK